MTVKAYGANAATESLQAMDITRRAPSAHDVQIDIAFCSVCHSDEINHAYERMLKGDVKYRFVIDNASLSA